MGPETVPARGRIRVRMVERSTDEPHRAASPLELLFDLTFVVAVAAITSQLAEGIAAGHGIADLPAFLQVFFAIWWAWMNFTWFASSYDTDDVPYRLLTMVQMAGVLLLAAGVPAAFEDSYYRGVTLGYVIMRVGLVALWLRAAIEAPAGRGTALRYATGMTGLTVLWLVRLVLSEAGVLPAVSQVPIFVALAILELAVPRWAERQRPTSWHPHHIAERYGLFTIILLGESVLAATTGVRRAFEAEGLSVSLVTIAVAGLVLLFSLWWLYFLEPTGQGLAARREGRYLWGDGHYGIFAALAAVGAGLHVAVQQTGQHIDAVPLAICYAVAAPVGAFLVLLWAVHAPVVTSPVIPTRLLLGAALAVLLLPLATGWIGPALVIAAIAAVCGFVVMATILTGADEPGGERSLVPGAGGVRRPRFR